MKRHLRVTPLMLVLAVMAGCRSKPECFDAGAAEHYQGFATQIEYPDSTCIEPREDLLNSARPLTVRDTRPAEDWKLSLQEAIQITLSNSEVIRDIGGRVLGSPATVSFAGVGGVAPTVYDVAIQEANPLSGPEAALSDFDAQFNTSLFFNRNQRTLNNQFFGGGTSALLQNTSNFRAEIAKTAATGTMFAMRHTVDYDRNNSPINRFRSAYVSILEGEVRQPLLQGAGIEYNRIAGPNATPGNYNGVLLGRVNTDIAMANFEASVRDLLFRVEQTYWQLYFAYQNLETQIARRDSLLQAWRVEKDRYEAGLSRQQDEALAREEYYNARADVEQALSGTTTSGLVVGTAGGVYTIERDLRLLMGIALNDGRLIRPSDDPSMADVLFDWEQAVTDSLWRRVELRRQKWNIKRREMELFASRNFLKMRLDFVGQYRFRGFGDDLLAYGTQTANESAYGDLMLGDQQEWMMGLQLSTPIGNRIGHTAVRHAELQLSRERAIYREAEEQVVHDLSQAFAEVDRAYSATRSYYNRRIAAHQRLNTVRAEYEAKEVLLRDLLDAQSQASLADTTFFRALVDYNLAVTNVHFQRGTLLDYLEVYLSEGPWVPEAYNAAAKEARKFKSRHIDFAVTRPEPISVGPFPQESQSLNTAPQTLPPTGEEVKPAAPAPKAPIEPLPDGNIGG